MQMTPYVYRNKIFKEARQTTLFLLHKWGVRWAFWEVNLTAIVPKA